jgi:hypothetical protein
MSGTLRSLSQQSRLRDFVLSESGEMSAKRAAQVGAVVAGSAMAGLFFAAPQEAKADCGFGANCVGDGQCFPWQNTVCTTYRCDPMEACINHCTGASASNC